MKASSNNKCVNTPKIINEEIHTYNIRDIKFVVRVINKNQNPEAVLKRLKLIAINHINTKN